MIMDNYEKEIKRRQIALENQKEADDSYVDKPSQDA